MPSRDSFTIKEPFLGTRSSPLASELLVDRAEGLGLVLNVCLLGLVKVDLEEACSVQADPDPLSNDLSRVDEIIQYSCMNCIQGVGPWTLLLQLVSLPGGFGQDPPLGNKDHMFSRELLLKLPHQPGLDLLEGLELRDGDEDHNSLLAAGALNLLGRGDVQLSQGGL